MNLVTHRNLTPRRFACGLLITAFIAGQPRAHAEPGGRAPDVVVIMADDMGYSDLGCFGGEIRTPHLDQLANQGLRFTNFYSENMCWVSRASLLTGVYHKASMVDGALHARCRTMAEILRANGYQTAMSGKWHLAGKKYTVHPMDRGFDKYYGILGGAASFFAPAHLYRDRENVESEPNERPDYYLTHAITSEAQRMIESAKTDRPLFLYVAYTAAHWPLHAPAADIESYDGQYQLGWDALREQRLARMKTLGILADTQSLSPRHAKVPAWDAVKDSAWQQRRMEVYAAQVTAMDRGIGQITEALRRANRLDNTLMFFTVDNGGCHVEYSPTRKGDYLPDKTRDGRPMRPGNLPTIMPGAEDTYQSYGYGWANASNTPYRFFKQYDYEGGIRTPMIAHWPVGIEKPGRLVTTVSHLIDILPTVLQVTDTASNSNLDRKMPLDGRSVTSELRGEQAVEHESLFFHHAKGRALRRGHWKLVSKDKGRWELYNLQDDPLELNDLAEEMPEQVNVLAQQWRSESKRLAKQAALK